MIDRQVRIDAALERRGWSPHLRTRIERLLDGVDDRTRLRCCDSGCFVCNREVLRLLDEIESTHPPGDLASGLR